MLSVLRRHAGWGLKVILGITILSFIFFFGFSTLQKHSSESVAIQVGKDDISHSRFQFFYNNQFDMLKEKFKEGQIPEVLQQNIRQSVQRSLIQRSLMRQFAQKMGLEVSDQELAETIMKRKDFDPVAYKDFLQYFYRQNGFSYEELVREDLLLQKFQNWAQTIEPVIETKEEPTWTFETTVVTGKDKKKEMKKVGPLTLAERRELFPIQLTDDEYSQAFSLTKKNATLPKPFIKGDRTLTVRLIEKKELAEKEPVFLNKAPRLVDLWFEKFAGETKIRSLLPQEGQ